MGGGIGESIPLACQDWANTKAAYRFFANKRVQEGDILSGHFDATRARFEAARGTVLLLQDTTEFTYQRARPELVGITKDVNSGKDKKGLPSAISHFPGILMYSSLAVTTDGLPLGLTAVKFWTRKKFKGNDGAQGENQSDARSPSRRRKACGGWKICGNRLVFSADRIAASTSAIARATFSSFTA